ncbi:MAG: hypothetical protein LBP67_01780 [Bacteroidales bacterium]|jgi:hypothetical protein|nr:hypothetical protein [Bacteroidales bacterium]
MKNQTEIKVSRELKILLLSILRNGIITTEDIDKFVELVGGQSFFQPDFSTLTDEELKREIKELERKIYG